MKNIPGLIADIQSEIDTLETESAVAGNAP